MAESDVKKKRTPIGKMLMWLAIGVAVASMAFLGFGDSVSLAGRDSVVTVGDSRIDQQTYARELQRTAEGYSQQTGEPLSAQEAALVGLPDAVLQRLASAAALDEIAVQEGLRVGDEALANAIVENPTFQGSNGAFSRSAYEFTLERSGLSEREFEATYRKDLTRTLLADAISASLPDFTDMAMVLAAPLGEKRGASYIAVEAPADFELGTPDEAALRAIYDEPDGVFQNPDRQARIGSVAYLTAADVTAGLTEAAMRQFFDDNQASFTRPEERVILRAAFPTEAAANAAKEEVTTSGGGVSEILTGRGIDAANASTIVGRGDLPDAIEAAVFDTETGIVLGPFQTDLGPSLYEVLFAIDGQDPDYDSQREAVATRAAQSELRTRVDAAYDGILDAIAAGATIEGIAEDYGLNARTDIDLAAENALPFSADTTWQDALIAQAAGAEAELIILADGGLAVVATDSVEQAAPESFETVRAALVNEWQDREISAARAAAAEEMMTLIEGGATLDAAAAAQDLTVTEAFPVSQREAFSMIAAPVALELYQRAAGEVWLAENNGGYYIARVDDILPFDATTDEGAALLAQVKDELDTQMRTTAMTDVMNAAINTYGSRTNPALIEAINTQILR